MVNFPNIEKIEKDINKLLNQYSTMHEFYTTNNKTNKPEYTKSLRKIYNQINEQIDKLRLYNNDVEKNNRDERNKKKGIETKQKKQVGRKKTLKGGAEENKLIQEDIKLTQEDIKLNQNDIKLNQEEDIKLNQEDIKLNQNDNKLNIFKKQDNEIKNTYGDDTINGIFTELENEDKKETQKGGRGRPRPPTKQYIIKNKINN